MTGVCLQPTNDAHKAAQFEVPDEMTDESTDDAGGSEPPYTTDELSESAITTLDIEDQIRYAIYNGNFRLGEIVEVCAFSREWTQDILEDMVEEESLVKETDSDGPYYMLPEGERPDSEGISEEEIDEAHEKALRERQLDGIIGDSRDIEAVLDYSSPTDTSSEASYGLSAATASDVGPDFEADSGPEPDVEVRSADDPPEWYRRMDENRDELPHPLPDWEEIVRTKRNHGGQLPVDRNYDWESEKLDPTDVPEFIDPDGMYEDIVLEIEDRRETGKLAHFCISGPTGCGKTLCGENIAVNMRAPAIVINCHEGLRPDNLLGMPTYVGDETWWVDGPATKALLASRERPVVLILDEVNRTTSRTLGVLMSILDHQCSVTLDARGGESVEGDPMNLVVFSTMNEGSGYVVNKVDTAQKRRLGNKYKVDYIGIHDARKEADLIAERTPISKKVAMEMVECANEIRTKASGDSEIDMGVPTDTMLDWAATAWSYRNQSTEKGALVKAAERAVINKFFSTDSTEEDTVTSTIESFLEGMPITDDGSDSDETGSEMEPTKEAVDEGSEIEVSDEMYLFCKACGWYERGEDVEEDTSVSMTCPECEGVLVPKETA